MSEEVSVPRKDAKFAAGILRESARKGSHVEQYAEILMEVANRLDPPPPPPPSLREEIAAYLAARSGYQSWALQDGVAADDILTIVRRHVEQMITYGGGTGGPLLNRDDVLGLLGRPVNHCCADYECGFATGPDVHHCECWRGNLAFGAPCREVARKRDGTLTQAGEM